MYVDKMELRDIDLLSQKVAMYTVYVLVQVIIHKQLVTKNIMKPYHSITNFITSAIRTEDLWHLTKKGLKMCHSSLQLQ